MKISKETALQIVAKLKTKSFLRERSGLFRNLEDFINQPLKLEEIKGIIDKVFDGYTKENGKFSFSGNDLIAIKDILDKEENND